MAAEYANIMSAYSFNKLSGSGSTSGKSWSLSAKKKKSDFLNQKHFLKIYICFLSELESIAMGPPKDFLIKVLADSYTGLLPT